MWFECAHIYIYQQHFFYVHSFQKRACMMLVFEEMSWCERDEGGGVVAVKKLNQIRPNNRRVCLFLFMFHSRICEWLSVCCVCAVIFILHRVVLFFAWWWWWCDACLLRPHFVASSARRADRKSRLTLISVWNPSVLFWFSGSCSRLVGKQAQLLHSWALFLGLAFTLGWI